MKKSITLLAFLLSVISIAQDLNQYKYALLPSKFAFQKEKDQYRLNTLSKLYLQKYGFEVYLDTDNQPDDFANINCNKVYVDVISSGGMFTTKLSVVLKDCKGTVLYTSKEGTSREKEYPVAYNQAIRIAFESMQSLNHQYQPSEKSLGMIGEPAQNTIPEPELPTMKDKFEDTSNLLFAKPISNGFQVVDGNANEFIKLMKTNSKNCFIATKNNIQGVLISNNNKWFFEYYKDDKLISEEIVVRF